MQMRRGVLLILLFLFLLSGCLDLRIAYVPDNLLTGGWHENVEKEESGSIYFGLEKWSVLVYEKGNFSTLTVATLKTVIMVDKGELLNRAERDIKNLCNDYGINLVEGSRVAGERILSNGHSSNYVIYNGTGNHNNYKIIGEVWSCSYSGVSIICMGLSKVSDVQGLNGWRDIVGDPYGDIEGITGNGLIYSVNCH